MSFELPPLPWKEIALEPHLSAEAIEYHYGKHHKGYVEKLNQLTYARPESGMTLEELIKTTNGDLFNNAAQVWNHTFYWNCMKPSGGGRPSGQLAGAISTDFGTFEEFKKEFITAAETVFGSGWTWLVQSTSGKLKIIQTGDCPIRYGEVPLLTIDVWEHAYYIDYRNDRSRYIDAFFQNLVNWDFVMRNFSAGRGVEAAKTKSKGSSDLPFSEGTFA